MSRKVFISVLGKSQYESAKYYFDNNPDHFIETRFIQFASVSYFCKDWEPGSKIFIFLTKGARETNWERNNLHNSKNGYSGLKDEFLKVQLNADIIDKDIPDGNNEDEIWSIFQTVYEVLQEDDEVYFDITHAYRSIPMLLMVLIDYAKFLKNIRVASITYGNWELGRNQNGLSPVVDITSFSILQDWSAAAQEFIKSGRMSMAEEVITHPLKNLSEKYKGENKELLNLRRVIKLLQVTPDNIYTCRSKKLFDGQDFKDYREARDQNVGAFFPPLMPLLNKLDEKMEEFSSEKRFHNGFEAVKWCINYNWIQQGYTLLQETLISYMLFRTGKNWEDETLRIIINSSGVIIINNLPESKWKGIARQLPEETRFFINNPVVQKFSKINQSLSGLRNDMNHGGIRPNPATVKKLKDMLPQLYAQTIEIIKEIEYQHLKNQ